MSKCGVTNHGTNIPGVVWYHVVGWELRHKYNHYHLYVDGIEVAKLINCGRGPAEPHWSVVFINSKVRKKFMKVRDAKNWALDNYKKVMEAVENGNSSADVEGVV